VGVNDELFINLDAPSLEGNERKYLNECIDTGWISWQGDFVGRTEKYMREYCGSKHCLTVVNGTYAMVMALQTLGIGPGDEVIVPTLTMSASAFPVTSVGGKVVWVDCTKNGFVIDPEDLKSKITNKTKAVIAVHLYGRAVDMKALKQITEPLGIPIIEDVAEGLGASFEGIMAGSSGDISCHSYHNKIVASGEGGAITLNDDRLYEKLITLRTASPNNYEMDSIALNNRMSNISSAVALAQLERIEHLIEKRRNVAKLYDKGLEGINGIKTYPENEKERCVYWRYQIGVLPEFRISKLELISELEKKNISTRTIFSLMSESPAYKNENDPASNYPNSLEATSLALDLPTSPILTDSQILRVIDAIKELS
jgi:perosamine synthetase